MRVRRLQGRWAPLREWQNCFLSVTPDLLKQHEMMRVFFATMILKCWDGKLDTRANNGESHQHGAHEAGQSRVIFCYF